MRLVRICSLLFATTFLVCFVAAQSAPTATPQLLPRWYPAPPAGPPPRDAQALAIVTATINALGGNAAIQQVGTCVVGVQVDGSPAGAPSGSSTLTVSASEFRSDFHGPDGTVTLSTGSGKPFFNANGTVETVATHVTRAWFWPTMVASSLLRELEDANYSFRYKGTTVVNSQSVAVVATVSDASSVDMLVTPQTWYISTASGLPVRVEYRLPDGSRPDIWQAGAADLADYQADGRVAYPYKATVSINGKPIENDTVTSIQPNTTISSAEFASQIGGPQ